MSLTKNRKRIRLKVSHFEYHLSISLLTLSSVEKTSSKASSMANQMTLEASFMKSQPVKKPKENSISQYFKKADTKPIKEEISVSDYFNRPKVNTAHNVAMPSIDDVCSEVEGRQ